jgi:hypothetical protein
VIYAEPNLKDSKLLLDSHLNNEGDKILNRYLKIIIYGFLVWLVPFAVSFMIYPLKIPIYPLFESILSVVIAISAVFFSYYYLKNTMDNYVMEGIIIGIAWFIISIALDLVIFMPSSPMQMSLTNYMTSIGPKYLIIPTLTIGMGYMSRNKRLI